MQRLQLVSQKYDNAVLSTFVKELKDSKDKLREIVIFLLKIQEDMNNKQIGKLFGGLGYSVAAKVIKRFSLKAKLPPTRRSLQNSSRSRANHGFEPT